MIKLNLYFFIYFTVFEADNLGDNPDKSCQKQASEYNDDTLVRSDDCAQQSQYSTEVRIFFPFFLHLMSEHNSISLVLYALILLLFFIFNHFDSDLIPILILTLDI